MQRVINRALSGDEKALALLDIGENEVVPKTKPITRETLRSEFKYASTQYLAAMHLNLKSLERLAKRYIVHLCWINRHRFQDSALTQDITEIDEMDILEEMAMLCTDLPLTRHGKDLSDSEEEDAQKREKRPSSVSNAKSSKAAKRSHHKKQCCQVPGCKFEGYDLKRHIQIHVRKGEISQQNVGKLTSIMSRGQKKRGRSAQRNKSGQPKKGRFRKWCPVPGCDRIVVNVGRHLSSRKQHNIQKNSSHYVRLLKTAKRYTGTAELQAYLATSNESAESEEEEDDEEEDQKEEEEDQEEEEFQIEEGSDKGSQSGDNIDENKEADDDEDFEEDDKEHSKESDYEDSENEKETAEKFFTATKFKNNRHQWLVGFYDYLSRPSAGHKKKGIKLQHAGQIKNILEFIDSKGDDIKCLANDEGDAVWKRFVVPSLESQSKKSGTIISYLTSFEMFLKYVTNPRYNRSGPPLYQAYIDTLVAVLPEIKGWRSTVDSQSQAEKNQRWLDESAGLLTPEEINALKESRPYSDGIKAINEAGQGKILSQQEFTSGRDVLLVRFTTDNATRPGPLNNAKLSDYEKAETSGGNRIMLIPKHKRAKDGSAILGMKPDLQDLMEIYVNKIRPQVAERNEDHLFVTVEGKKFPEGTIGRRVQSLFEKAKLRDGKRFAHVSVRKFVTTKTKEKGTQQEAAIVQRVMAHSSVTAERSYVRTNLTELGSKALHIIERVTGENENKKKAESEDSRAKKQDINATTSTQERSVTVETVAATKPTNDSQDSGGPKGNTAAATSTLGRTASVETAAALKPTTSSTTEQEQDSDCEGDCQKAEQPSNAAETASRSSYSVSLLSSEVLPPTPGRALTDKQKEAIKKVFNREITAGTKVSKATVQNRCCTTPVLAVLASSLKKVKQVVNHVNYIIDSSPKSLPTELPKPTTSKVHGWLDEFDDRSTRSSGKRQEWDEADTTALEKTFKKYPSLPSTAQIKGILRDQRNLADILDREGWTRVYTKIKNIFKKKAKK